MFLASLQIIVCQYWVLPMHFVPNVINITVNHGVTIDKQTWGQKTVAKGPQKALYFSEKEVKAAHLSDVKILEQKHKFLAKTYCVIDLFWH